MSGATGTAFKVRTSEEKVTTIKNHIGDIIKYDLRIAYN